MTDINAKVVVPSECPACNFVPDGSWAPPLNEGDVFDQYGHCRSCCVIWWKHKILQQEQELNDLRKHGCRAFNCSCIVTTSVDHRCPSHGIVRNEDD